MPKKNRRGGVTKHKAAKRQKSNHTIDNGRKKRGNEQFSDGGEEGLANKKSKEQDDTWIDNKFKPEIAARIKSSSDRLKDAVRFQLNNGVVINMAVLDKFQLIDECYVELEKHLENFIGFGSDPKIHCPLTDTNLMKVRAECALLFPPGIKLNYSSLNNKTAEECIKKTGYPPLYVDFAPFPPESNGDVDQRALLQLALENFEIAENYRKRVKAMAELLQLIHQDKIILIFSGGETAHAALDQYLGDAFCEELNVYKGKDDLSGFLILRVNHPCAKWMSHGRSDLIKESLVAYQTMRIIIANGGKIDAASLRARMDEEAKKILEKKRLTQLALEQHFDATILAKAKRKIPSLYYQEAEYFLKLDKTIYNNGITDPSRRCTIVFGVRIAREDTADKFDQLLEKLRSTFPNVAESEIANAAAQLMSHGSFVAFLDSDEAFRRIDELIDAINDIFGNGTATIDLLRSLLGCDSFVSAAFGRDCTPPAEIITDLKNAINESSWFDSFVSAAFGRDCTPPAEIITDLKNAINDIFGEGTATIDNDVKLLSRGSFVSAAYKGELAPVDILTQLINALQATLGDNADTIDNVVKLLSCNSFVSAAYKGELAPGDILTQVITALVQSFTKFRITGKNVPPWLCNCQFACRIKLGILHLVSDIVRQIDSVDDLNKCCPELMRIFIFDITMKIRDVHAKLPKIIELFKDTKTTAFQILEIIKRCQDYFTKETKAQFGRTNFSSDLPQNLIAALKSEAKYVRSCKPLVKIVTVLK
eukprot:CAMPEP_0197322896 /NCGR_PEP_ID=MMETSP0891-20130614/70185_1 /TAXON_ID=44058 ORGANISM="Aureoumbra lagunensis, Strain CCMP1510" /NCGR_SAMPLE_ID=MMETSP0891 /ASSEMBLY_ACC=CAM_ASM_000534 /LENGTH=763 /DNA_ID=CAMNT_0042815413 /DNA_START=238 /DNA_END=2530 /DNA_ORIENTATION=-